MTEQKLPMISGPHYRITVLTDRLVRLEYQEEERFTDQPTQVAICRDFPSVPFEVRREGTLQIETATLLLSYDEGPFSSLGLSITLKATGKVWHYGVIYGNSDENLFGTARTLDMTDGFVEMEPGLFGKNGYAVLNDSTSPILDGSAFVRRPSSGLDLYFFGYGTDFFGGLRDFYHLTGKAPLIPRYALGNWWSRYYPYSEESYGELLQNFEKENIPLSVAVLDMDWHLTEVDEKYGTGWTGYTWNRELFPEPARFLASLKEKGLAVTLNLHPADGIRGFEEMYPAVARRMGLDPETEEPVVFDFADPTFRRVYFEEVLHPMEKDGVDFWWIDWQQGTGNAEGDIDPLLLLNHYHYKDQEDRGVRPMIFSRYAGAGSHRYPIGFSGDTRTTWRSLAFQPWFTSTASNIGYGWWSHDIGGHMLGDKDDDRLIRWIQYGVFSPIMRIHSSNSPFFNKEPWTLGEPHRRIMGEFMRLRHRLLPYLYTAAYEAYKKDLPIVQPLYYHYPSTPDAYEAPNAYFFGSSLLVAPITEKNDEQLRMGAVNVYLPEGRWIDLFTGQVYQGGKKQKLYRTLDSIPVLLPAGGILPLDGGELRNGTKNPASLRILIGAGASGSFTLYEDDGSSMSYQDGAFVTTALAAEWLPSEEALTVSIAPAEGELSLIPEKRDMTLVLCGYHSDAKTLTKVTLDGREKTLSVEKEEKTGFLRLTVHEVPVQSGATFHVTGLSLSENDRNAKVFSILDRAWIEITAKEEIYRELSAAANPETFRERLLGMDIPETLKNAIMEVL